jgi:hypothetical protein
MGSRLCDAFQHVAYRMDGSRGNHMGTIIALPMGMPHGGFWSGISRLGGWDNNLGKRRSGRGARKFCIGL